MVSSVVGALLLQAFLVFHAHAGLSAADLAGAEAVLRELLEREKGEICGSGEINKLLAASAQLNSRLTSWNKIEAISAAELDNLDGLMRDTLEKLEDAKRRLEAKKLEEQPELMKEDIVPIVKEALAKGGFDLAEEQAVASAKLSQCGRLRAKGCQKLDPKCKPERTAFKMSMEAFKELMSAHLQSVQSRASGPVIDAACKELLPPEPLSYCPQMCETMANDGQKISNDLFGQTAGKTSDEIQAEVDALTELGTKYRIQDRKCREATEALKGFKLTLAPLEVAIETTFEEWMKANSALDEAEDKLEDLKDMMDEQEATVEELGKMVKLSADKLEGATAKLLQVKAHDMMIRSSHELAVKKLQKTKGLMEDGEAALRAAERVKEKLAGSMESMVNLYDWFVHEPLRNMMLDSDGFLHEFDVKDSEIVSRNKLQESMTALSDHCEQEAKPSFEKITEIDLAPLCEFGGPEAAALSVKATLEQRKEEVKKELMDCLSWYRDFSIPESAGTVTSQLVEPVLLGPLTEAYPDATFASEYMPDWMTGGKFLSAMEELRNMLHDLDEEAEALKGKIATLMDQIADNAKLREEVSELVRTAIAEKKLAEDKEEEAKQLLASQQAQRREQEENISHMKQLADAAYLAYQGALGKFSQIFNLGTVSLIQAQQAKVLSASQSLKKIRRLS